MIKLIIIILALTTTLAMLYQHMKAVEFEYTNQLIDNSEQQHFSHQFKKFSLTNTNSEGIAQSIISAPTTRMITTQHITLMDDPEIIMQREQEPPIIITAKQAEIFHAQNQTSLHNDVKVVMTNKNNNNIVMTTQQLTVNNHTQHAKTDLPATIVHSKGNMHGTGVEFNPHTKQIKFLSEVRGIYEH